MESTGFLEVGRKGHRDVEKQTGQGVWGSHAGSEQQAFTGLDGLACSSSSPPPSLFPALPLPFFFPLLQMHWAPPWAVWFCDVSAGLRLSCTCRSSLRVCG